MKTKNAILTVKTICTDHQYNKIIFTTKTMKFSIKDFFSKCDQIRGFDHIAKKIVEKSNKENSKVIKNTFLGKPGNSESLKK